MVPSQLIARVDGVDGLPALVAPERVWPTTAAPVKRDERRHRQLREDRQTAVVRQARLPRWTRQMLLADQQVEEERLEIRGDLARAGLL